MSNTQVINLPSSSPSVPISFTADDGSVATPAANNINNLSSSVSTNNDNGIQTRNSGDTTTVQLTNRVQDSITTADATLTDVIAFPLPAAGTYVFNVEIAAFNQTDTLAAGYSMFATVRTDGATATKIGTEDKIVNEEGAMSACNVFTAVTGNQVQFQVQGIAAKSIKWNAVASYAFVSTT